MVDLICNSGRVTCACTDSSRTSINWRILSIGGIQKILSFNVFFDMVGSLRNKTILSFIVSAKLTRSSESDQVTSSTLFIDRDLGPSLSAVSCNNEIVSLIGQMSVSAAFYCANRAGKGVVEGL